MDKAGDFVEDKVEEIQTGEAKEKIKGFSNKAEQEAKEKLSKAKDFGKKVADKVADKLDDLADDIRDRSKRTDEQPPSEA
jgi:gas vesicle protein